MENAGRAGPIDSALAPAAVDATAEGTWHAVPDRTPAPAPAPVPGICLDPPCSASATLDLRIRGLPELPYGARLEGGASQDLGLLVFDGAAHVMRWSEAADHTDKLRLVITLADQPIAGIDIRPSAEPVSLDGPVEANWRIDGGQVRLNEIGGVTISTVVTINVQGVPPPGWTLHAFLDRPGGATELGALAKSGSGSDGGSGGVSHLDARVERLPLEDQDRLVVVLRRDAAQDSPGFPVLELHF